MEPLRSVASPGLQHAVEQWYYREARLLDNRQYKSWLALCCEDIQYVMPGRGNPLVDNTERGHESMIEVARELEGPESDGLPIRDESFPFLAMRVERSYKANAWAENPPARTRRIVGNVEILENGLGEDGNELRVLSNFHLHYARPGSGTFFYAGQRDDRLRRSARGEGEDGGDGESFRIAARTVVMDLAEIDVPTLGVFL